MKYVLIFFVRLYQIFLSPLLGKNCMYYPTCSAYSIESLKKFGALKGSFMTVARLIRCNPWAKGGFDPVPDNLTGEAKWVL